MKLLVTGVTGYIGAAVTTALARAGHRIVALTRSLAAARAAEAAGHAPVMGDLRDPGQLASLAASVDGVVWCATSNDGEVDAAAVGAVLEAIAGTDKVFLYTSGVWVHGDSGGAIADETSPLRAPPFIAWRVDVERAVLGATGVRSIVIRPGIVYGDGGGLPATLVEWARRDGLVRMPGDGSNHWPVVHLADLADLYVRAIEEAPARTTLVAVHRSVRFRDVAVAASLAGGAGGEVAPWPIEHARAALGDLADALALDQRMSSLHALRLLDWRPSHLDLVIDLRAGSYAPAQVSPP